MGNQTSASASASCLLFPSSSSATTKLFDSQGNLRRVKLPVTAAELMLEDPGHAVSSADDLRAKRRVVALRADDDLMPGKVYLLLPIKRINSKVSDTEMAIIANSKANKSIIGRRNISKVLPVAVETEVPASISEGEEEESSAVKIHSHYRQQWNPVLEPILEWNPLK